MATLLTTFPAFILAQDAPSGLSVPNSLPEPPILHLFRQAVRPIFAQNATCDQYTSSGANIQAFFGPGARSFLGGKTLNNANTQP
jgi:hypothetical protein